MIHYHGTPIGGSRQDVARFLIGRHALVSFAYQNDMAAVAEFCQSFVLDNGAFTAWKQGKKLDIPGYITWARLWCKHPNFDWALIPDIIEGSESDNDDLVKGWVDSGMEKFGVPVWHLHESLDRLVRLCEVWRTVAIGSSAQWSHPGTSSWWLRMSEVMSVACDENGRPRSKLHGLRMLNPKIFNRLPLSSADSTNAAVNSGDLKRFGMYPSPSRFQRAAVIADRTEAHNSAPIWASGVFKDHPIKIDASNNRDQQINENENQQTPEKIRALQGFLF